MKTFKFFASNQATGCTVTTPPAKRPLPSQTAVNVKAIETAVARELGKHLAPFAALGLFDEPLTANGQKPDNNGDLVPIESPAIFGEVQHV